MFLRAFLILLFYLYRAVVHRDLHSFPTRRSSDLSISRFLEPLLRVPKVHGDFLGPFETGGEKYFVPRYTFEGPNSSEPIRRSEEHTSELQSHSDLVCRLLLE